MVRNHTGNPPRTTGGRIFIYRHRICVEHYHVQLGIQQNNRPPLSGKHLVYTIGYMQRHFIALRVRGWGFSYQALVWRELCAR